MHIMAQEGVTVPGSAASGNAAMGLDHGITSLGIPVTSVFLTIRLLNEQSDD